MMPYFVISICGGEPVVKQKTKQQLLRDFEEGEYDDHRILMRIPHSWQDGVLIIKGKIVQPWEKKAVTRYSVN